MEITNTIGLVIITFLFFGCVVNADPRDGGYSATIGSDNNQPIISPQQINASKSNDSALVKILDLAEVSKHSTKSDCWLVINGKVADVSKYTTHPSGDTYVPYCGKDATDAFASIKSGKGHSSSAKSIFESYVIGNLGDALPK